MNLQSNDDHAIASLLLDNPDGALMTDIMALTGFEREEITQRLVRLRKVLHIKTELERNSTKTVRLEKPFVRYNYD